MKKRIEFITDYLHGNYGVFQGTKATLTEHGEYFTVTFDNGNVFGNFDYGLKVEVYKRFKII